MLVKYIVGLLITFFSIFMFQLFGMCLVKKEKSYSYSFTIGFIVYSFFVAILGIPIQVFNLPWSYFFVYMILLLVIIISFIIYSIIKKKIIINSTVLKEYFMQNWFLYLGAFVILLIALGHIDKVWSNNLTDDSYYINKMSTIPYMENPFRIDPVTGFVESGVNSYSLNTFELEASFYMYISGLTGTLYARVFLALLNYFILLNAIHAFIVRLFEISKIKFSSNLTQYIVVPIFIIFVMNSKYFIISEADWTIYSAAYFGSALVRVGCPFMCLLPLIGNKKLDGKKIVITLMTCIAMISKSTVAVPVLFVCAVGYLMTISRKSTMFIIVSIVIMVGLFLPSSEIIDPFILDQIADNMLNVWIYITIIVLGFLAWRFKEYYQLIIILIVSLALMIIPEINDSFEIMSNYIFVAERSLYSMILFAIIVAFSSLLLFLVSKYFSRKAVVILGVIVSISCVSVIEIAHINNVHIVKSIKLYYNNSNVVPRNTVALGKKLESYYQDTGVQPIVFMHPGMIVNDNTHFTAAILRSFSPHTISITGSIRTQPSCTNKESGFFGFSIKDLDILSDFIINPNTETVNNLEMLNSKYAFNTLVSENFTELHESYLNKIGYTKYSKLYDESQNYSYLIYVKHS